VTAASSASNSTSSNRFRRSVVYPGAGTLGRRPRRRAPSYCSPRLMERCSIGQGRELALGEQCGVRPVTAKPGPARKRERFEDSFAVLCRIVLGYGLQVLLHLHSSVIDELPAGPSSEAPTQDRRKLKNKF
jgi:hypothetical protein